MGWLIAVVLRPFGALAFFGLATFLAYFVFRHLIPNSRVKNILFDPSIQKRHPWKFAIGGMAAFYGTVLAVAYIVT